MGAKDMFSSIVRSALVALMAIGPLSCAVVRVQTASKEDVEVTKGLGFVSVQVKPGAGTVLVDSTSFGAVTGFDGFALGYHRASFAVIAGDRCQLVLWIRTNEQLKELNELLRDRTDVCVVRPEPLTGENP